MKIIMFIHESFGFDFDFVFNLVSMNPNHHQQGLYFQGTLIFVLFCFALSIHELNLFRLFFIICWWLFFNMCVRNKEFFFPNLKPEINIPWNMMDLHIFFPYWLAMTIIMSYESDSILFYSTHQRVDSVEWIHCNTNKCVCHTKNIWLSKNLPLSLPKFEYNCISVKNKLVFLFFWNEKKCLLC